MDAARIEDLKAKNPGRQLVELTLGEDKLNSITVIGMIPTVKEIDQLRELSMRGDKAKASMIFVQNCILEPSAQALNEMREQKPLLLEKLGDELMKLAGSEEKVTSKKL
jgi:hypothetical protein